MMRMRFLAVFVAVAACEISLAPFASAAGIKSTLVANNLQLPIQVTHAPGDYQRLFVCEQHTGRILILRKNIATTTFITIGGIRQGYEEGLLGMAFHPDYQNNRKFYVHYIANSGASVIAELLRDPVDPDKANIGSHRPLITLAQPFNNHNGGQLQFSPIDGYLYIAFGDGGDGGDPGNRAQTDSTFHGKMLRIDVDNMDEGKPYAVPGTNPHVGPGDPLDEIWAKGLRNPWRFSFDRLTGDLWIGDVGQQFWEEISYQPASSTGGENYGWRLKEGDHCFNPSSNCDPGGLTDPVFEYHHNPNIGGNPFSCSGGALNGNAVIGGFVYRGPLIPEMQGRYFFSDNGSSRIWSFVLDNGVATDCQEHTTELNAGPPSVNSVGAFGEDALGELYICDLGGELYKIESTDPRPDGDGDDIPDLGDNCPSDPNPNQENFDGDAFGDVCDDDDDDDTVLDGDDNCPLASNTNQEDEDGDGVGDACDVCPGTLTGLSVDAEGCPPVVPGDFDRDGDVDLSDFGEFQICISGPGVNADPGCDPAKFDEDSDVDQDDFGGFQNCMSGPNIPADVGCN